MKIRIPLFIKIMTPVVLLIVLTVAVSGYLVYLDSEQRWQSELDTRLERVVTLTARAVSPDALQQVRRPADQGNEAYSQVKQQLSTALTAGNLNWIGIYRRDGDYLYYWVDTSDTGVDYPFFYATPEHFAAFEDRLPHRVSYTDEFGSYYGFVAPIIVPGEGNDGPRVEGLVEAVVDGESAQLFQQSTWQRVFPILLFGIAAAVVAANLIALLTFARPLRRLERGALALAQGDFGHTIDLRSRDELGDLAATFNQMSAQLARLYGELQDYSHLLEDRVALRTAELQAERNRLDTIVQNIADGLVVTDSDGRIVLVNPAFVQIVQTQSPIVGQPLSQAFPSEELAALVQQAQARPGEVRTATLSLESPGQRTSPAHVYKTSACALVQHGSDAPDSLAVRGVVAVLHDVTHEAEVDRMKTEFTATVSHELRTPLTAVLGFARLIGRSVERDLAPQVADDSRGRQAVQRITENLGIIVSESERLMRLINDLLDIAKMEAGKVEWHMGDVAMEEVIRSAVSSTSSLAESKGLTVQMAVAEGLPTVQGDQDRLVQVVTNLLSNSVKFTDEGWIAVRALSATVGADGAAPPGLGGPCPTLTPGDWLVVSVQDTGIGIPIDRQPEIFQKFKQVSDGGAGRPAGTGLGLAICKEIVEHHGGRIWVESQPDLGSTFTFVLPA